MLVRSRITAVGALLAVLSGCGGGGGGGGPVASTLAFNVATAYRNHVINGEPLATWQVTGTCQGVATTQTSPQVATVFEGVVGYYSTQTLTLNLANCTGSGPTSGQTYYDSNYRAIGEIVPNASYVVYQAPENIPTTVKVGDSGPLHVSNDYTDGGKQTLVSHTTSTYRVAADTATTALIVVTESTVGVGGQPMGGGTTTYKIDQNNVITLAGLDVTTQNGTHIVLSP